VSKSYTYCSDCGELRIHDREPDGVYLTVRPCRCEAEPAKTAGDRVMGVMGDPLIATITESPNPRVTQAPAGK
jgi:hypothetical protein